MPDITNHLERLQKHSRKYLNPKVTILLQDNAIPRKLVRRKMVASANYVFNPKHGTDSLSIAKNRLSIRRTKTLSEIGEDSLMWQLNSDLMGGSNYPVLTAVLGTVSSLISSGAGFFFSATTTGLDLAQTSQRVLARPGDEIWHVEEIGKDPTPSSNKAVYVSAFFIVDPYRKQAPRKGWLIHEERYELVL